MGGCLSLSSSTVLAAEASRSESTRRRRCANVISPNGDLHQYTVPLTVSQVLEMELQVHTTHDHDQPSTNSNFFVCNSDRLYYDDYIPALDAQHPLQPDQIYFVIPASKLQYRLTASDMAALAVKASLALQKSTTDNSSKLSSSSFYIRNRRNNKSARISPILVDHVNSSTNTSASSSSSSIGDRDYLDEYRNGQTATTTIKKGISIVSDKQQPAAALGVSKSGSVRKLQRYSSRRAKMAVRSFTIRLTTIYEDASAYQFY